jgi:putative ABC transport system permease protein
MMHIGWKHLRRDPLRAGVAVTGIVFSVILITLETGLLSGLMRNASLLIDSSRADLWITAQDVPTIDFSTPLESRQKFRIEATPGIEKVEEFSCSYSVWKLANGTNANVQITGLDLRGTLGPTVQVVEGNADDLLLRDTIMIDQSDRERLGNPGIGDTVEIYNHRARIVGFTRHMKTFTTIPYVFTNQHSFHSYSFLGGFEKPISLLIKIAPGFSADEVKKSIMANVPGVEAYSSEEFSWRTRRYWLIETGMGIGFLGAALLGLLVGGVIVSQTLYAMTLEKLPEYAVLKAMGASMSEVALVVLEQGLVCGVVGVSCGLGVSVLLVHVALHAGTIIEISLPLIFMVTLVTMILCIGAALVSVVRLYRVEPAMVFRS